MTSPSPSGAPNLVPLPEAPEIWQQTIGWQPQPHQQFSYQRLYEEILQGNQQLNLTRITEPQEFWEKHLWDSLRGIQPWLGSRLADSFPHSFPDLPPLDSALQVIDIGTGAGFPGLPVAIACPEWQIVLLDATRKKIAFLETLVTSLGLAQVKTQVGRAEQVGQMSLHREAYDIALIRAVAAASVCAEYALPLLKLGGVAVLYRGQWQEEETQALTVAVQPLGGALLQIERFETPLSQSLRHCIYLKKVAPTKPEFPRPIGIPTQKPL